MTHRTISERSYHGATARSRQQERKPTAATTWATLSDYQQGIFCMHHPSDRIEHTMTFVTPVVVHWLEQQIAQWVHHEGLIRRSIAPGI